MTNFVKFSSDGAKKAAPVPQHWRRAFWAVVGIDLPNLNLLSRQKYDRLPNTANLLSSYHVLHISSPILIYCTVPVCLGNLSSCLAHVRYVPSPILIFTLQTSSPVLWSRSRTSLLEPVKKLWLRAVAVWLKGYCGGKVATILIKFSHILIFNKLYTNRKKK